VSAMSATPKKNLMLFSGRAHPELAEQVAKHLDVTITPQSAYSFANGEIFVRFEESVRGCDAFVLQSHSAPINDQIMEQLIMVDALKRASAGSITAVLPYYGYARQDRKVAPRTPITAKLVADLLTAAGVQRVVSVDLHAGQIQGFYSIPFDHLYAMPVFLEYLRARYPAEKPVFVSPDAGGVERTRAFAKRMDCDLAIVDKRRERANVSEVMNVIGDIENRDCVIVDDMIDTAGTLTNAAQALKDKGARSVSAAATHAVLSGPAVDRIANSVLDEVVVSDTVPLSEAAQKVEKIKVLSVSRLLGEAIKRIHNGDSVSSLFV
jgi:ribose-phosphate pyrophosphokinase